MGVSVIDLQREAIVDAIRNTKRGEWKILVVDEGSWRLIQNVAKEDDILNVNITNIEHIEQRRNTNREMDAVYFLSPEAHIAECLIADLERRRYKSAYLLWTSRPDREVRARIDECRAAREHLRLFKVLDVGYYPREAQVITFKDPWSFPILFHPSCNRLVKQHLQDLSQKIVAVCVSLGEYPNIRYYRPQNPTHEASVLCSHLAKFVQDEIDMYAQYHQDFPPQSARPRGTLYILDRSMDLIAPLVHEFTYQAMAHDLLPIKEGEKVTYRVVSNEGRENHEQKDVVIGEGDKLWVAHRHRHMKDTIEKLMGEFQKFLDANPHFKDQTGPASLSAIKDMMIGLPQFQEMKEAYSLHLTMAQDCMNTFERLKLPDVASIEQSLATGLDEDYKKPKNVADQLVRMLDEESIAPPDRLRLILLYLLFKDGLLPADTNKLLAHAQLPPHDREVISNLDLLGARVSRQLKDPRPPPTPLFPPEKPRPDAPEQYALSRFHTVLKQVLQAHHKSNLDQEAFPFTKPQLESNELDARSLRQASLRSAKPTWAKSRGAQSESRQRVFVFMAGGATYSEARACYEISDSTDKDVYLLTSHMLTPRLFLKQVGDLSADRRQLRIPAELPKPKVPAHLYEQEQPPPQQQSHPQQQSQQQQQPPQPQQQQSNSRPNPYAQPAQNAPPTAQMQNVRISSSTTPLRPPNGTVLQGPDVNQLKKGSKADKVKKLHLWGKK